MFLNIKNVPIFYQISGCDSIPAVLLHGFLENHTYWNSLLTQLPSDTYTVSIDLPGHGQSGCLGNTHTMEAMAEVVLTIIEHLKIPRVQIIGHSMGGYVGLAFAKVYPEKTASLCLLNSSPLADTLERREIRNRSIALAGGNYRALVSMSVANLFSKKSHEHIPESIEHIRTEALKTPPKGYRAAQRGMMVREDNAEFWKNAGIKKMMVLGKYDVLIDAQDMEDLFKQHVEIHIVASGHMSLTENPTETARILKHFIQY